MTTNTTAASGAGVTEAQLERAGAELMRQYRASKWDDAKDVVEDLDLEALILASHPPAAEREAPGGEVVPEGWRLVPAQATLEMLRSAANFVPHLKSGQYMSRADDIYRALLAAAPPPPAKNGGDGAREKALREAAAICERWAAFAQLGIDVPCDVETNRMLWYGRHQYAAQCRDEILALLATPAEGQGNG